MLESVFSLRFLLLVIGALIVAAIYLWGSAKSKRNARIRYDPRRARFEPPKRRSVSQASTNTSRPQQEPDDAVEYIDEVVVSDAEPVVDLPVITREGADEETPIATERKDSQLELTFDVEMPPAEAAAGSESPEAIIALYVRPPQGHEFAGAAIVRAMNSVGLRFGDMNIFHHYGAGDLRTDAALFSVANMVEPGDFDLQAIENFATPGLAMFLRLPGPLDGAVAFELFLNTAQRLAEALSGELYGEPKKLLDGTTIDKMRRSAEPFASVS